MGPEQRLKARNFSGFNARLWLVKNLQFALAQRVVRVIVHMQGLVR